MPITPVDITNENNTGIFDILMNGVVQNLDKQFVLGRFKGSDYATVYLGSIQTVVQTSIQYLSTKSEVDARDEQSAQDLLNKASQKLLLDQQLLTENANTDTAVQNALNSVPQGDILEQQALKISNEKDLLAQKKITEYAQTNQVTAGGVPTTDRAGGLVGAQTLLYIFQTNGFKNKVASDSLKTLMDMWSIAQTQTVEIIQQNDSGTSKRILEMAINNYNNAAIEAPTFDSPLEGYPTE